MASQLCHICTEIIRPVFRYYMEILDDSSKCTTNTFGLFRMLRGSMHSDPRKFNNPQIGNPSGAGTVIPEFILHEAIRTVGPVCWDCHEVFIGAQQGEDTFRQINRENIIQAQNAKTRRDIRDEAAAANTAA